MLFVPNTLLKGDIDIFFKYIGRKCMRVHKPLVSTKEI